jgi:hypothetical protein
MKKLRYIFSLFLVTVLISCSSINSPTKIVCYIHPWNVYTDHLTYKSIIDQYNDDKKNSGIKKLVIHNKIDFDSLKIILSTLAETNARTFEDRAFCKLYESNKKIDTLIIGENDVIKYKNRFYTGGIKVALFFIRNECDSIKEIYGPDTNIYDGFVR